MSVTMLQSKPSRDPFLTNKSKNAGGMSNAGCQACLRLWIFRTLHVSISRNMYRMVLLDEFQENLRA